MGFERKFFGIFVSLMMIMTGFSSGPAGAASDGLKSLGQGTAAFTLNLYRQMLSKEKGNIFFSPYSIELALAMAYAGARGDTAGEMARTLGFTLPAEKLHPALAELSQHLHKVGNEAGQTLSVANAVWLNHKLKVLPEYLQLIRNYYSQESKQLDFCQGSQARKTINDWVSQKTKDRIKDLIPEGALNCDTMLVLTNAIYFLGEWADKFEQQQTKPEPFWLSPDRKVEAPFMHRKGRYAYAEAGGCQVLELPYREKRLSMVVFLPKDKGGLAAAEQGLTPQVLDQAAQGLSPRQVEVSLPKFEIKAGYTLNEFLKAAGLKMAFTRQADFSGITAQQKLWIDLVVHKAWVKVEEKGTEAAAATGVMVALAGAPKPEPPVVFKADHPFIFFIKDRETGLILFWGRLSTPQAG